MRLFKIIAVFFIIYSPVFSQPANPGFVHLGTEQGLSHSNVHAVFQDRQGFLWFSTRDGLNKYDGYKFSVYRRNMRNKNSISSNDIKSVAEDKEGLMWIATWEGGVNCLDPRTQQFKYFRKSAGPGKGLTSDNIECLFAGSDGNIWVGTEDAGLNVLNRKTGRFRYYRSTRNDPASLSGNNITCFYEDKNKTLWVGTTNGLNRYNRKSGNFTRFAGPGNGGRLSVKFILEDSAGDFWIGTYGDGLKKMDRNSGTFDNDILPKTNVNYQTLLSAREDNNGNLWIGTENNGLLIYNIKRKSCISYLHTDNYSSGIGSNTINAIAKDRKGNMWLATSNAGVDLVNTDAGMFTHYQFKKGSNSLSNNIVNTIFEDASGNLWIGTDGGGLDRFDRSNRRFTNYSYKKNEPESLAGNFILSIAEDSQHRLWLGTWGDGLTVFHPSKNTFKHYRHQSSDKSSLSSDNVFSIYKDSKDRIWIGTYGGGLDLYDPARDAFTHYRNTPGSPHSLSSNFILTIAEGPYDQLLIGTDGGGLNILDIPTGNFRIFRHSSHSAGISNNSVRAIWPDKKGKIWLGTNYGLNCLDPATGKVTAWFSDNGLSNDIITAIQDDHEGNLWISTARGLTRLDSKSGSFRKFVPADGLQGYEFKSARCLSRSGKLYLGGTNGFNEFDPSAIKDHSSNAPLVFTGFEIFNKEVAVSGTGDQTTPLKESINTVKEIVLSYKESVISFDFALLNYADPEKNEYAYKMTGFDHEWHRIGNKNSVTYTNLDPGRYVLQVRALAGNERWSAQTAEVRLIVTPPFWKTWWFKSLFLFLVTGGIALIFYSRLHTVRQRNRYLEAEVSKRTRQLEESNSILVENNQMIRLQNEELEEYNREMVRKTDKILQQQDQIVRQNQELENAVEELEVSNQTKDRFFSILAHDLRNPVAALAGISDLLKARLPRLTEPEIYSYVNDIHKSSGAVYELLISLLDWAKTQRHSLSYHPEDVNIYDLIIKNYSLAEQSMKSKNLRFTIRADRSHTVYADPQMTDTVIRNVIGNSIKFTPSEGEVIIETRETDSQIVIVISDNGIGMTPEQIHHLFDLRNQKLSFGTEGEQGTGLGLVIAKEFLTVNKGTIEVESVSGQGSSFIICLPKAKSVQGHSHEPVVKRLLQSEMYTPPPASEELYISDVKGRKILIVEDNLEVRTYLKLLLSSTFEVFEAENGDGGFESAIAIQPAVVISDMVMPVMDGLELCEKLKADTRTSHIPLIMLTSRTNEENQLSGYKAGADTYLLKPVKKHILFQVICNFIRNQEKIRLRFAQSDQMYPDDISFSKPDKEFLDKVLQYIEEHLPEPDLDHKKICELTAMSRTILYAKFKSLTGQGVHDFIKTIRLKKGLKLLQEGRLNINQISYEVGFNTPSYFSKSFIKQYGLSPSEYVHKLKSSAAQDAAIQV